MRMNSPEGKQILALIRDGAFAHAGETEAIDLTLDSIPKDPSRKILDAGCGLGGTADYVTRNGWGHVTGFDIDAKSIEIAKARFPACTFAPSDAAAVGSLWQNEFDLIYSFNAVYAFPDQPRAFRELATTARPGATLLIFDYTDPERRYAASAFAHREEASFWQPLHPDTIASWAQPSGWNLKSFTDLSAEYVRWYDALEHRIRERRPLVIAGHGEPAYEFVLSFYTSLRDAIAEGILGGGLFAFERIPLTREP